MFVCGTKVINVYQHDKMWEKNGLVYPKSDVAKASLSKRLLKSCSWNGRLFDVKQLLFTSWRHTADRFGRFRTIPHHDVSLWWSRCFRHRRGLFRDRYSRSWLHAPRLCRWHRMSICRESLCHRNTVPSSLWGQEPLLLSRCFAQSLLSVQFPRPLLLWSQTQEWL